MGYILWIVPIIGILLLTAVKDKKLFPIISVAKASILLIAAIFITRTVMLQGKVSYKNLQGLLYIDSVSIIALDIVVVIGLLSAIYSINYLNLELLHGKIDIKRLKLYYILMDTFIYTMVLALTVNNMGIMWIAIEATTLASAFLVGFYNDKEAIEGTWKYVIICSVGIGVAFLGIILLQLSSIGVLKEANFLQWTNLYENATALKPSILKLAFIFLLVGFGTKAGLAPMHTWLPDAHSQAPSPISALLSGVLLNSAMYGIIRMVSIVNKGLGESIFTGRLLISLGVLSIGTSAIFIITQKDYKRLLAYSSIEHMGIIAIAIGLFTPASIFAALFHMINHSATKAMLFFSSGNILQKYETKDIGKIKNLLKILPVSGFVFFAGIFAIAGTPPFSVFASEFNVILSIFNNHNFILGGVVIGFISIIFVGIAMTLFKMFYGTSPEHLIPGDINIPGEIVMVCMLIFILITGIYMPLQVKGLLLSAEKIIIGG
ncbi:MAG TPA: hydrogenase 4 subunit F [Clostridiaceae bacterium]